MNSEQKYWYQQLVAFTERFQWFTSRISLQKYELLINFCEFYSDTWDCNGALRPLGRDTSSMVGKGAPSSRTAHRHSGDGGGKRSGPGLPLSAPSAKCSGFPWSDGRVQLFGPRGVRGFVLSWGNLFYGIKPGRYLVLVSGIHHPKLQEAQPAHTHPT